MSDYYCTGGCPTQPQPADSVKSESASNAACPCRASMVQALQMLLRSGLAGLVDFQGFGFITENFLVGVGVTQPDTTDATYDNLTADPAASFSGFTPCACNYVDVSGAVYSPAISPTAEGCFARLLEAITANADTSTSTDLATLINGLTVLENQVTTGATAYNEDLVNALNTALTCPATTGFTVSRLPLCSLCAVVFQPQGTAANAQSANYQSARQLMQQIMQTGGCRSACPPYPDPCCDPCNCSDTSVCPGRSISLTAGPLALMNATVLGNIGRVLVLANDTQERFYFVCTDQCEFIR